ncbi:hypothetical protein [Ferrimonas pelagia]|uniref:Outer membrane protein beta-barrel domain-containing protein n=1 Tax=Ferrimonas pelagia TaxID=1177826 RepID=A0ABP9F519_9GAMM
MVKYITIITTLLVCFTRPAWANEEWFFQAGAGVSAVWQKERDPTREYPTHTEARPSVQLQLHRQISERLRLGVGVEALISDPISWRRSENLLMFRVAELDYALSHHWSASFYGGVARYYRELPAYGYGFGFGLNYWLAPNWSLSAELNYTSTDTSNNWVDDPYKRDDFAWGSTTLRYRF